MYKHATFHQSSWLLQWTSFNVVPWENNQRQHIMIRVIWCIYTAIGWHDALFPIVNTKNVATDFILPYPLILAETLHQHAKILAIRPLQVAIVSNLCRCQFANINKIQGCHKYVKFIAVEPKHAWC